MVKKAQFYIIEATLAGLILIVIIGSIIYSGSLQYTPSSDYLLSNYCEDSLQVLVKRELLQNDTAAINELKDILPDNVIYCLRIDNNSVNDYGCSKLKYRTILCKTIYSYIYNGSYIVNEVQLLLS